MANFQDNVEFGGSTLGISGDAIRIGTAAGMKTIFFQNSDSVGALVWQPSGNVTVTLPAGGGALLVSSQGILSVSAGATRVTSGEVVFSNSNGISFGANGNTITASHNGLTSQSNQAFSAAGGSSAFQTLGFSDNAAGSFTNTDGSVALASVRASLFAVGNTTQSSSGTQNLNAISFDGAGFISVGVTNGSVRISGTQTNPVVSNAIQAVGSATGSGTNTSRFAADDHVHEGVFSFGVSNDAGNSLGDTRVGPGRHVLRGGDNVTLSQITGAGQVNTIVISAAAGGGGGDTRLTGYAVGNTTLSSSGTIPLSLVSFRGSNNASVGVTNGSVLIDVTAISRISGYAVSNTTQSSSGTLPLSLMSFGGAGLVSVGVTNGSIVVSGTQSNQAFSAAGGSSAFQTLGFSDNAAGSFTNTNGSIAIASIRATLLATSNTTQSSSGTRNLNSLLFAGAGGVSIGITNGSIVISGATGGGGGGGETSSLSGTGQVSISTNGSTISIGVPEKHTYSRLFPFASSPFVVGQQGNATWHVQPFDSPDVTFDRFAMLMNFSGTTGSTNTISCSMWMGIYTRNASTLSLYLSTSTLSTIPNSGTNQASINFGMRWWTIPITSSLSEGRYWIAIATRSSTAGGNASWSQYLVSQVNSNFSGVMQVASTSTAHLELGLGTYSASSTAIPGSIGYSQIRGAAASLALRTPVFAFFSSTI